MSKFVWGIHLRYCAYCGRETKYIEPRDGIRYVWDVVELQSVFCDEQCAEKVNAIYRARRLNLHPLLMLAAVLAVLMMMFVTSPKHTEVPHVHGMHRSTV